MKRFALSAAVLFAGMNVFATKIHRGAEKSTFSNIISITNVNDFKAFTKNNKSLIVVEVFSATCPACSKIAPTVTELAQKYPQVNFVQVKYQDAESIVDYLDRSVFEVSSFPTFIFYKNSEVKGSLVGANKDKLKNQVAALAS